MTESVIDEPEYLEGSNLIRSKNTNTQGSALEINPEPKQLFGDESYIGEIFSARNVTSDSYKAEFTQDFKKYIKENNLTSYFSIASPETRKNLFAYYITNQPNVLLPPPYSSIALLPKINKYNIKNILNEFIGSNRLKNNDVSNIYYITEAYLRNNQNPFIELDKFQKEILSNPEAGLPFTDPIQVDPTSCQNLSMDAEVSYVIRELGAGKKKIMYQKVFYILLFILLIAFNALAVLSTIFLFLTEPEYNYTFLLPALVIAGFTLLWGISLIIVLNITVLTWVVALFGLTSIVLVASFVLVYLYNTENKWKYISLVLYLIVILMYAVVSLYFAYE
jgi:hypothetical protein